jgi:alkylresorcinol/alkylpyrone synthase
VAHPGGPKVLDAFARGLRLPPGALDRSWASMAALGNLSSSSVLHVLADELAAPHRGQEHGLLFALGPGVSAEFVLLRWPEAVPALAAA